MQAPGYNAPGSPLLPTEGPAGVSPTQLGTPKEKELHRPWSSAGADGCPVRGRLPGPRAAPGREEAETARVGGECSGLRCCSGPGCTAASASQNFLGTASLGRSSPSRPPPATRWDGASPPPVRNRLTKGMTVRAHEGSQEKANSGGTRLPSVLPFSQSSQTFYSTLGRQECPNLPALQGCSHYKALGCRPLPGPEG